MNRKKKSASQYQICIYMDNLHFLPNNILTKLFKEFIYIYIYKNDY